MHERLAELPVEVESVTFRGLAMDSGGWERLSTVVELRGAECVGEGEDVTYEAEDQRALQQRAAAFELRGRCTIAEFSRKLDAQPLFDTPPVRETNWLYRRWAFESAALDLALRQADTTLAAFLGVEPRPVRYVVSMALGDPPSCDGLRRVRELYPDMGFKVDLSEAWTEDTVRELAAIGGIATVDLKGHYRGWFTGPVPDAQQYRMVAEGLPDAWIEDPWWEGEAWEALAPHRDRITWDANFHSLADLLQFPFEPRCVNIKPSRFGFLSELFRVYEYRARRGIAMYGGGQFELGPGRGQIQALASLFHGETANDVAPSGFNVSPLAAGLPSSPLPPRLPAGFRSSS